MIALGIGLEEYEYPYPVQFLSLSNDLQQVAMAYMDIPPSTEPNGQTVVLFHGKAFGCYYFRNVIEALTGAGYRPGRAVISDSNLSLADPGLALPVLSTVESRADVITITSDDATGAVRPIVISEPQASPPRQHKWWTWLTYIAFAGRR